MYLRRLAEYSSNMFVVSQTGVLKGYQILNQTGMRTPDLLSSARLEDQVLMKEGIEALTMVPDLLDHVILFAKEI